MKVRLVEKLNIHSRLRIVTKFLVFPRIIDGTLYWLQDIHIAQRYCLSSIGFWEWKRIRVVDHDEYLQYKKKYDIKHPLYKDER